ncbi:MAG: hypothetical protein DMG15_00770 [Acidobacteria bacterium]|nr:MAG: hypothetical protein DMG15_00770 [Acidobacteriota bacterium]
MNPRAERIPLLAEAGWLRRRRRRGGQTGETCWAELTTPALRASPPLRGGECFYRWPAVVLGALLFATPVLAHHEILGKFDDKKPVTLKGTVTKVDWANPHVHVFLNVLAGTVMNDWAIELESPVDLQKAGWKIDTVKPGDALTVQGIAARNGSRQVWGNSVRMTSTNKKIFDVPAQTSRNSPAAKPTPRWPDGHPRLGPPPGETGYWASPSATALVQSGVNVQTDAYGLLKNIADIDKVAPFQRWARDLYELRQRNFLKDDPMFLFCKPPGGPRQFQTAYGVQFVEDLDRKRVFVFIGGGNHNYRIIYTDGRAQQGQLRGDADNPLYYGRAVARWEGDTFVVDTKGFNEKFWFTNGGLPHTEQLHLIEHISRPDFNTLKYEVTIDDLGAYSKIWSSSWTLNWISGEELPIYYCQDNRP